MPRRQLVCLGSSPRLLLRVPRRPILISHPHAASSAALLGAPPSRSYRSELEVQTQYRKLFLACDVDRNGFVTMEELRATLFRFGLNRLGNSTLETLFLERALSEEDEETSLKNEACNDLNTMSDDRRPSNSTIPKYRGARLDFHNFVDFVEHAVELKTALDRKIPEGTSPLWWRKFKRELGFYKVSFSLLWEQTKSAALIIIDHGRNLSRNERRLVWIAVLDFAKVLPFAALLVAPGGSLIAPFMAKVFPSMMPSTFKMMESSDSSSSRRSDNDESRVEDGVIDRGVNKTPHRTAEESRMEASEREHRKWETEEQGYKANGKADHSVRSVRNAAVMRMYEARRAEMRARGEAAKEMYEIRRARMQARGEAVKEMLDSKPRESRVAISTLEVASRILDLERELREATMNKSRKHRTGS